MSKLTNRTGVSVSLTALAMVLSVALGCGRARAASFVKADVTTLLGPAFFVDDGLVGGTDTTIHQPSSGSCVRTFGSSATGSHVDASNGEYSGVFDAPLVATLNIAALKFQVSVTPTKVAGNGSVLFPWLPHEASKTNAQE